VGYLEELLDFQNFQCFTKEGNRVDQGAGRDDVGSASLMSDRFEPKGNLPRVKWI
jgi:hypothetical protein